MANTSDGHLVTVDHKNRIKIWNDLSFTKSRLLNNNNSDLIRSIALIQNRDLLAVGNSNIEIWNLTNKSISKVLTEHEGIINALESINFMNKTYLLSSSQDNTIRVWDANFENIQTLREHTKPVTRLAYNPIHKLLASSAQDDLIRIWSPSFKVDFEKKSAHENTIMSICVLNNGLIATGSWAEIKIWKKQDNESSLKWLTTLTGHSFYVNALVVLKNNSLVSGSEDKTIKIWNQINETWFECVNTLKQARSIFSLTAYKTVLLISCDIDGKIYIWNQTSFQFIQKIVAHSARISSIIVLDNGNLASGSYDYSIKIWKKVNETWFEFLRKLTNHAGEVNSLAVLPNGMFASASSDKSIRIWNQNTLECVRILADHINAVTGLAVLEKSECFVSISFDRTAIVWDSYSFVKIEILKTSAFLYSISLYSDDSFLTSDEERTIKLWDNTTFGFHFLESFHATDVLSLVFFGEAYLLSGHSSGEINVWTMDSMRLFYNLRGHVSHVTCLISLNNQSFSSGSADRTVKIWNYDFTNIEIIKKHSEKINALILINDSYLLSSSNDRSIRIYKTRDLQIVNELKAHSKAVFSIAVLDENKSELIATCSADNSIKIWNNSSELIANLSDHNDYVYVLEYSFNYKLLISGSKDASIKLWHISNSTLLTTLFGHEESVVSLELIGNSNKFSSGSCDFNIIIWDLASFTASQKLEGHFGCVYALAVLKSKFLLSGSSDKYILIWDIENEYSLIDRLEGHNEAITSLAVLDNRVASGSADRTINIWSASFKVDAQMKLAHKDIISTICVLSNGLIATGSDDKEIKIWKKFENISSFQLMATLTEHEDWVSELIVLRNKSLVSCSWDTIKVWNQINDTWFECVNTFKQARPIYSVAIYESILLINGDYSGGIYIWNLTSFELLQQIQGHSKAVRSIILLDNSNLATASFAIKIWMKMNETSFEFLKKLTGHTDWVNALVVLPRNMFASASQDKTIRIWNQLTLECMRILTEHSNSVLGLAVLKNGYFVSISYDKTAIVWDNSSFSKIATVTTPTRLYSVCSYLDSSFVIGDTEGTIQIRSQILLKYSQTLNGHTDTITDLTFFKDGILASSSLDGTIRIWERSFRSSVELETPSQAVFDLNVFRNGSLISCSLSGFCHIWDTHQYILNKTFYKENY